MAREIISRKASDNQYLHRDFHGALSIGLDYLEKHYGAEAVREYLRRFAEAFYAPLTAEIKKRGLAALRDRLEQIYRTEGAEFTVVSSEDELVFKTAACPAVTYMRRNNYPVSRLFVETTRTVNEAICAGTPFAAELSEYDPETGRSVQRFTRLRPSKQASAGAAAGESK